MLTSSSVVFGSSAGTQVIDESGSMGTEWVPAYFHAKQEQAEAAFEEAALTDIELVTVCPTLVVGGPSWRLVPSNAVLVRYLLDPTRSTFDGGCNIVAVTDVARGHVLLAERGTPGESYLLGGENVSWRTLHTLVSELAGIDGPYLTASTTSAWLTASALELAARIAGQEPLATRDEARTLGRWYWYTSDKARSLGYAPGSARAAVAAALGWLVASPHVPRLVREGLTLADEVYAARALTASPSSSLQQSSSLLSSSQFRLLPSSLLRWRLLRCSLLRRRLLRGRGGSCRGGCRRLADGHRDRVGVRLEHSDRQLQDDVGAAEHTHFTEVGAAGLEACLVQLHRDADVRLGPWCQVDASGIEGDRGGERRLATMSRSERPGLKGHPRDLRPGVGDGEAARRLAAPGARQVEGQPDVRGPGVRLVDVLAGRDVEESLAGLTGEVLHRPGVAHVELGKLSQVVLALGLQPLEVSGVRPALRPSR